MTTQDDTTTIEAVLALLASHRTIRQFEADEVPDGDIRRVVEAAQMASTSSNVQGYSLLRVRDTTRRAQLVEWTGGQPQVAQAGAFFVLCADQRRHRLVSTAQGRPYAPNLETFLVAVIDAALFAQNLALGFEALGLGICFIGGLRNRLPDVDRLLELPSDVLPLFGLCVGVPTREQVPARRPRLPLEAVLFEDSYPTDAALAASIARYDVTMRAYYEERGQPGHDWSGGLSRKFQERHREHLRDFFVSKGACLE